MIVSVVVDTGGQVGVHPRRIKILTTDDSATVSAAGYLNNNMQVSQWSLLVPTDIFDIFYSYNTTTNSGTYGEFICSISGVGVITLTNDAESNIPDGSITLTKLQSISASRLLGRASASGAGSPQAVTLGPSLEFNLNALQRAAISGDVTIGAGSNNAVIAANAVTLPKLSAGIAPSHVVKFGGSHTTTGGNATETFTVTGAATSDFVLANVSTLGVSPEALLSAKVSATNTVQLVFAGDPSTDHVVSYMVFRAAA